MKYLHTILILLTMLLSTNSNAQDKKRTKELKALGREKLIELAEEKIKKDHPEFLAKNYDQIKIMANNNSVYITFNMSFKYVPLNSSYYYGIYIDLVQNMTSKGALTNLNTNEVLDEIKFFTPNEKSKAAIEFVIESINKSDEVGSIPDGKLPEGNDMTIYEREDYYKITVDSYSTTSTYNINKSTGEIYNASHKHKAINPYKEEDTYKEIK